MTFLDDLEALVDGQLDGARTAGFAAGATSRQGEVDAALKARDDVQAAFDAYRNEWPAEVVVADLDLSGVPVGPVTGATLAARLGATTTATGTLANMLIGVDTSGRKYVQTTMKAGTFGGSSGSSSIFKLSRAMPEETIEYDVMVSSNFQPVRGGKMGPGLAGVIDGYPIGLAAGNQADPDAAAMSMRVMFRPLSKLVSYVYHYGQARPEGDDVPWVNATVTPGVMMHIKMHHRLNDPGQANGILQVWFNDVLVLDVHDYVYRRQDRANLLIGYLYWSIFYGGNDSTWAPTADTWVRIYDGLTITTPA